MYNVWWDTICTPYGDLQHVTRHDGSGCDAMRVPKKKQWGSAFGEVTDLIFWVETAAAVVRLGLGWVIANPQLRRALLPRMVLVCTRRRLVSGCEVGCGPRAQC